MCSRSVPIVLCCEQNEEKRNQNDISLGDAFAVCQDFDVM